MFEIKSNADEIARAIGKKREKYLNAIEDATRDSVDLVWASLPKYPPPGPLPAMQFKSLRQLIFVIQSIREGSMRVPYRRTRELMNKFYRKVDKVGGLVVGKVGTSAPHAPWVISAESIGAKGPQASIHKGIWWTLHDVVKRKQEDINRIFRAAISKALK
jgi:hypothetical protein